MWACTLMNRIGRRSCSTPRRRWIISACPPWRRMRCLLFLRASRPRSWRADSAGDSQARARDLDVRVAAAGDAAVLQKDELAANLALSEVHEWARHRLHASYSARV